MKKRTDRLGRDRSSEVYSRSLGVEIESKAYVGETSGRHSEALSLFLHVEGKGEGVKNYSHTYLE